MRSAILFLALALAACGERSTPPAPIAPPDDPPPDDPPPAPEPEPAAPSEAPPPPLTRFEIPAEGPLPALVQLPVAQIASRGSRWQEPRHPDPIARRRLAQLIEELAYVSGDVPPYIEQETDEAGCIARLATERVVSIECLPLYWHRSGTALPGENRAAAHFVISGSEVRPFALAAALREGETWADLIDVPHCVSHLTSQEGRRWTTSRAPRFCRESLPTAQAVLTPRGVDLMLGLETRIPRSFQTLREHVREEGPIAWIFAGTDAPRAAPADAASGWSVGEVAPMTELAARSLAWPDDVRSALRIADRTLGAGEPVVPTALGLERAQAIARAIGGTARASSWDGAPLRVVRARLTESAPLHAGARGDNQLRVLPAGTIVGAITPAEDGLGPAGTRLRAATALRQSGFARVESLVAHDGCAPAAAPFVATIPEAGRAEAEERMTVAATAISGRDVTLFVTRAAGRTYVRVESRAADCAPGEVLLAVDATGLAYDVRTTTTAPDGGETLLVLGLLHGGDERRYEAFHVPSGRRVLSFELDPEQREPDDGMDVQGDVRFHLEEDGERWPIVVEHVRFRWDGRQLVEDEGE